MHERLRIIRNIARGMGETARQGIVHRDMKPDNIVLSPNGDIIIADFGISLASVKPGTGEGSFSNLVRALETKLSANAMTPSYFPTRSLTRPFESWMMDDPRRDIIAFWISVLPMLGVDPFESNKIKVPLKPDSKGHIKMLDVRIQRVLEDILEEIDANAAIGDDIKLALRHPEHGIKLRFEDFQTPFSRPEDAAPVWQGIERAFDGLLNHYSEGQAEGPITFYGDSLTRHANTVAQTRIVQRRPEPEDPPQTGGNKGARLAAASSPRYTLQEAVHKILEWHKEGLIQAVADPGSAVIPIASESEVIAKFVRSLHFKYADQPDLRFTAELQNGTALVYPLSGARLAATDLSAAQKKFGALLTERSKDDKTAIEEWLRAYQKHYLLASSAQVSRAHWMKHSLSTGHYKDGTAVQATEVEVKQVILIKEILSDPEISAATKHDKNRENELVNIALFWARSSGARLAQTFINRAENADPESLILIARVLLKRNQSLKNLPLKFPLGNAVVEAKLDKARRTGIVYFYDLDKNGKVSAKPFTSVRLTADIVKQAYKLEESEREAGVKITQRSEALEAFADDQSSTQKARQFYNQLKKNKAPDVQFNNERTAVLRFTTEKKLRPEKMELYRKQLETLHSIAGKKVLIQFAQIRRNGKIILYGPSDPTPKKGEDYALFHLSELSRRALKAAKLEGAGFASVPGLADDETVIPFVALGVFLTAMGRLSDFTDSIQQLWRNVRGADASQNLDPGSFRDIRKVQKIDLQRYSQLQLRAIARFALDMVLEYTRLALQAAGTAA